MTFRRRAEEHHEVDAARGTDVGGRRKRSRDDSKHHFRGEVKRLSARRSISAITSKPFTRGGNGACLVDIDGNDNRMRYGPESFCYADPGIGDTVDAMQIND